MALHNFILIFFCLAVITTLIVLSKNKIIKKKWLKKTTNVIAILAVFVMLLQVILFPDLSSVKTTGNYSYLSTTMQLTDETRLETFKDDGSFRKLSVLVYYPSDVTIPPSTRPLAVFSHGGISYKTSNISLFEELASYGYVVVSIDHTYHSLYTEIDGSRVWINSEYMRELNSENSNKDIQNSFELFSKWMKLRTEDINFVIEEMIGSSTAVDLAIQSLIDKSKIALVGHSLGGSAALGVARQRDDIQAVIALESPFMYDVTGYEDEEFLWNTEPYSCAILNIYSDSGYPLVASDNKYAQNKKYLYNDDSVEYLHISDSNHYTLTDLVRKSPIFSAILGGGYSLSGFKTLQAINEKCLEFLNKQLL